VSIGGGNSGGTGGGAPPRRAFLRQAGRGVALLAVAPALAPAAARALAQGAAAPPTQSVAGGVEMPESDYKPVQRPPKPNAVRQLDATQVETLERTLACPCPCTLDIYTCRTTDFTCSISPAVHGDIQRLVDGGHTADEIMAALLDTYGDFILMSPRKQGFNLLAWIAPAAAVVGGAVGIGMLLRRWRRPEAAPATPAGGGVADAGATPEELARLEAALRDDR
jgi:cytochrome c-type biogenesis protein CcmH